MRIIENTGRSRKSPGLRCDTAGKQPKQLKLLIKSYVTSPDDWAASSMKEEHKQP